jgi:hypothetical protein
MKSVPFYPNTQDDLHCYQACLRMVLDYFLPEKEFSMQQLEELTGFQKDKWTWPNRGMVGLSKMGFIVEGVQNFDIIEFSRRGAHMLVELYGSGVAQEQIAHSDIEQEQRIAHAYIQAVKHHDRIPSLIDINTYLSQGYILVCSLNAKRLYGQDGYSAHSVVVYDISPDTITIHDPGVPPYPAKEISVGDFEAAWAFPTERAKNIIAFKL